MAADGRQPAIDFVLSDEWTGLPAGGDHLTEYHTTSLSLARALAVGVLSRMGPTRSSVGVWDPAAGTGFAGSLVSEALRSAGMYPRYRGQEIDEGVAAKANARFGSFPDAEVAVGDTLASDASEGFFADLAIVDAPWGMEWSHSSAAVEERHSRGEFRFGLPQRSDSTWLFISLALEKLRPADQGGGRVAALVTPGALSSGGPTGEVRRRIVEEGLLESVTRLPDRLAPNTSIPLYLLTFSNRAEDVARGKTLIADLQTMFTNQRGRRSMPVEAFWELESGLRTRRPGPRNRAVFPNQFTRRDAKLSRTTCEGARLSWTVTTRDDTAIDGAFLTARYGADAGVMLTGSTRETVDIDPSRFFTRGARDLIKNLESKGWPSQRLSALLVEAPERAESDGEFREEKLFVPMGNGRASVGAPDEGILGRVLALTIDTDRVEPAFLAAWLNTVDGTSSRRLAMDAGSSGTSLQVVRSDTASLMKWADELVVPVPAVGTQAALASADERLRSFQAELDTQLAGVWSEPESAWSVVDRFERAFDDSLEAWLEQLPFPIASALWTALTVSPAGEQQRAFLHAWEGIAIFHATVLLSACRTDPELSEEVETSIRETLHENRLAIEMATFKTWNIIMEKTARELRSFLDSGDANDEARISRAFAGLGRSGIERLVSKDLIRKFNDVIMKRNRWLGHSGFVSDGERRRQVDDLVADLREFKAILGDVWRQLVLVRAGRSSRTRERYRQEVECATGTRSPFATETFSVGEPMIDGELYLLRDGSETPLQLTHFVQLRSAPSNAQFTTYFYNRTDGPNIRMVSYQHGPESEVTDDVEMFREHFGALSREAGWM